LKPGGGVLADVLAPHQRIVFCGSAVGTASARAGAYYAGPGNRFWQTLHEVGLTPHRVAPADFESLSTFGFGLTDLCKFHVGQDHMLHPAADDAGALAQKIIDFRPAHLAFNGKRAAWVFLTARFGQKKAPACGLQARAIGVTRIWVLPSTSGAARRWWDIGPWQALADAVASASPQGCPGPI